ncbi:hypothetical protein BDQ94DRAFT_164326 [Aspergillus welwitschiae]|uniref:C2H2-type domain-containing protein n=1 Tax=Aspergillus welwitschiae TaxID=1341132 RepID=A0A3F3PIP6_9EURO|nr:hypothetical protein BDQ94DRAFT_164326 [Aspergillus welwitschiae]RDH26612.1 hypothetical protein BDQ94DRAFT_164326 [Aspergillus welwitschiae]
MPEQKYLCTAKECTKKFASIGDWRIHVEDYSFDAGRICLYDSCGLFIPASSNESLAHGSHLYLKHHVEPCRTEELRKAFIDKNFCSAPEGRMWCSLCRKLLELDNRAEVLDHFQGHIRDGSQFKIPGQTKYPDTNRARQAEVEPSARSANEGKDDVVDLTGRGILACHSRTGDFPFLSGCYVYSKVKLLQPVVPNPTSPGQHAVEDTNCNQLALYRILLQVSKLPYTCPLCLHGYSRYDNLYEHFKTTKEAQHMALKNLWFRSKCPVCNEPVYQVLQHLAQRHPVNYQSLMKQTLRLRHEVNTTIPRSPACFEHIYLFPLRRLDRVVSLPTKKQKRKPRRRDAISEMAGDIGSGSTSLKRRQTENLALRVDVANDQCSRLDGVAPSFHTSGLPGHRTVQLDAAHPPSVGNTLGHEFYGESNLVQSALAGQTHSLSFPSPAPLPQDIQEPRIDLSARGYMSHLSTEYQVPWETFVSMDIHQEDTGDGW